MALDNAGEWEYYKELHISDPDNVSDDYQIMLVVFAGEGTDSPEEGKVYCDNKCHNFPNDIRFGTTNNPHTASQLPQYIDDYSNNYAVIWIKLPSDNSDTIYMFIGNSSVNQYSNGSETFIYYNDGTKTSGWITCRGNPSISTDGDYLDVHCTTDETVTIYDSDVLISEGVLLKTRFKQYGTDVDAHWVGFAHPYGDDCGYNSLFAYDSDKWNYWRFRSEKDGNASYEVISESPDFYNFHLYEIAWYNDNGTHTGKFWYDGELKTTKTDDIPTTGMYVSIQVTPPTSNGLKIDYIIVRKYPPTKPTWSSFGEWKDIQHVGQGWQWVKELNISQPVENYQMRLEIHAGEGTDDPNNGIVYCDNHCENFPNDIRFGTSNNPLNAIQLPQWIERYNDTNAVVWIKLPEDCQDTIYMFVGNASAELYSDAENTFDYFIDMSSDNPTDNPEWSFDGSYAYENGYLRIGVESDNHHGDAYLDLTNELVYGTTKTHLRILVKHNPLGVHGQDEGRRDYIFAFLDDGDWSSVNWGNYGSPRFQFQKEVGGAPESYSTDSNSLPYDYKDKWWLFKVKPDYTYFRKWDYDGTSIFEKDGSPSNAASLDFSKIKFHEWQGKWAIKIVALCKYVDSEPQWSSFGSWELAISTVDTHLDAILSTSRTSYISIDSYLINSFSHHLNFDALLIKEYQRISFDVLLRGGCEVAFGFDSSTAGKCEGSLSFSTILSLYPYNLTIYHPSYSADFWCTRWDESNWSINLELLGSAEARNTFLSNITPGAVSELYNILGEPKYIDTTYSSGNTFWLHPRRNLGGLRSSVKVACKSYSDTLLRNGMFRIKMECVKL